MELLLLLLLLLCLLLSLTIASFLYLYLSLKAILTLLHFRRQSIRGPFPLPIVGNASTIRRLISSAQSRPIASPHHHQLVPSRAVPHYHLWSRSYGKTFLFWFGCSPRLALGHPDLVRRVVLDSSSSSSSFSKVSFNPLSRQLFGEGLVGLSGHKWALHRKVLAPAFSAKRVKGWVPEIGAAAAEMLERWEREAGGRSEFEVEAHRELHALTADVISRVAFGSSYKEGRRVFELQEQQMKLVSLALRSFYFPGFRFLPTKKNRRRRELNDEIRGLMRRLIEAKKAGMNGGAAPRNLIELMIESNMKEEGLGMEEIISECKTFYFAGKETTANLLSWTVLLLGLHQDWQTRCREEVMSTLGGRDFPIPEDVSNFKLVSMVLNEVLRLYPPAVSIRRISTKSTKLGSLDIPAGTEILLPSIAVNQDVEIWGEDASQFNPLRFAESRKPVGVFFPFGFGPSICIGQTFALVEAKVAMAMILRRYTWNLSPSYVHAPMLLLTLQPQYGVQVLLQRL